MNTETYFDSNTDHSFICDTCGTIINSPEEGMLQFFEGNDFNSKKTKVCFFTIVHDPKTCIVGHDLCCTYGFDSVFSASAIHIPLTSLIGSQNIAALLSLSDKQNPIYQISGWERIVDTESWNAILKRLLIPSYDIKNIVLMEKFGLYAEVIKNIYNN